jgi:hypothetical protein
MSDLGHLLVLWSAGLLAGTLFGWMLGTRHVGIVEREEPARRGARSVAAQDGPRLRSVPVRKSA